MTSRRSTRVAIYRRAKSRTWFFSRSSVTYSIGDLPSIRPSSSAGRSEEHTAELQSHVNLVCRLLLEKNSNRGGAQRLESQAGGGSAWLGRRRRDGQVVILLEPLALGQSCRFHIREEGPCPRLAAPGP